MEKKQSYIKFTINETINFHNSPTYVWEQTKIFKNKWIKVKSNSLNENLQFSQFEAALDTLAPPWAPTDPTWTPDTIHNPLLETPLTYKEFNDALNSRKNCNSPGPDGISYQLLKNLPASYHLILIDIYNEMFEKNDYPSSWSDTYIHFIPKPNGNGLRPIALTSCLLKIFEIIITRRMQCFLETKNLIPSSQSGFRKGKSCTDNLTIMSLDIHNAFSNKKDVLAAFLDVQGAFPNVNNDILLTKLAKVGCPKKVIQFLRFITYERNIYSNQTGG